jgi:hypothetical protein
MDLFQIINYEIEIAYYGSMWEAKCQKNIGVTKVSRSRQLGGKKSARKCIKINAMSLTV